MSCVLRVWGEGFDVAKFFLRSSLQPDAVYENGEATASIKRERPEGVSGFNLTVSDADFDSLEAQIREALLFLDLHEDELRRLGSFPGVEGLALDFGVRRRDVVAQTDTFPSDFLWRSGALDISLQITHYECS